MQAEPYGHADADGAMAGAEGLSCVPRHQNQRYQRYQHETSGRWRTLAAIAAARRFFLLPNPLFQ